MPTQFNSRLLALDSSLRSERNWTCGPARPRMILSCSADGRTVLADDNGVEQTFNNPLDGLAWMESHIRRQPAISALRWVGHLNYDLGRFFERLPSVATDDLRLPLYRFGLIDRKEAVSPPLAAATQIRSDRRPTSTFSREEYLAVVASAKEYIAAGDIFQVNLAQRFTAEFRECATAVYSRLRDLSPAAYGALLDWGDYAILSNSPELFLDVSPAGEGKSRRVLTRPIKGTRPRISGMDIELRDSVKDQAELNMIVDLERNDLGRVCRIGSVRVIEPRRIEPHPTVYHGVATIAGELRDDVGFVDLLQATFPGGSVTGAPRIRAMQIIDELEPVRRGPYCGAIGCLDPDGSMRFNLAIRTMIAHGGRIHIPVGGGIVADSVPAEEYQETLVKARAMFAAVGLGPDTGPESFSSNP